MVELLGIREGRGRRGVLWVLSGDVVLLGGVMLVVSGCGGGIELERGSDTGSSAEYFTDKITNDTSPTFVLRGEKGKEVEVVEGGVVLREGTLGKESGEVQITVTLTNDAEVGKTGEDHTLEARYKGGGSLGSITIRLDTKAPLTPTLAFFEGDKRIKEISDGTTSTDVFVTYEVGNVESGTTVRLYTGGSTQVAEIKNVGGGTELLRAKVKANDSVTARVIDKAGNESAASGAKSIAGTTAASVVLAFSEGERRVDLFEEGEDLWRGELGEGFDEDLWVEEVEDGYVLRTSLEGEGRLVLERKGDGERLEVEGDDVVLEVSEGEWNLWVDDGDGVVYVVGVGGDWFE